MGHGVESAKSHGVFLNAFTTNAAIFELFELLFELAEPFGCFPVSIAMGLDQQRLQLFKVQNHGDEITTAAVGGCGLTVGLVVQRISFDQGLLTRLVPVVPMLWVQKMAM